MRRMEVGRGGSRGEGEVGKGQGLFPGELLLWVKTEGKIC